MDLAVADWERLESLRAQIDHALEESLVGQRTVEETMRQILRDVGAVLGLNAGFVETFGEDMRLSIIAEPATAALSHWLTLGSGADAAHQERVRITIGAETLVIQPLDVVGTWFGRVGFVYPKSALSAFEERALHTTCELIDNYLYGVFAARKKHDVMMRLGKALRHRLLGDGLTAAVAILAECMDVDHLVLIFQAQEGAVHNLVVQHFRGAALQVDTMKRADDHVRVLGSRYLRDNDAGLLAHFGIEKAQEEVLINGITKSVIVGKVIATSKSGAFNTFARELLASFAGFIRQRVVDFNKEWRTLAASFRDADVARLLSSDDYQARYLSPRQATVGILYVDIAGFTRISEQCLKTPENVARLVEFWSERAVRVVWQHGGVFDKMVGDCIIALFGPPFYDDGPAERLAQALRVAREIRKMTEELPSVAGIAELEGVALGVSTGVNLAPLFVGTFGPNANFTGFSSGMNNTARLQGVACSGEILVMGTAAETLLESNEFRFGAIREAKVKNVADPLRFRALED